MVPLHRRWSDGTVRRMREPAIPNEQRRADLAALKKAAALREHAAPYTAEWQAAVDLEELAVARVRRWLYGHRD